MIVCICHRVSDRDIAAAVHGGCTDFLALQETTRVATACGACGECAQALLALHARLDAGSPELGAVAPAGHRDHAHLARAV